MRLIRAATLSVFVFFLVVSPASAGPYVAAGDIGVRHDIQLLADAGVIKGTVTTWPLAWGAVLRDLNSADLSDADYDVLEAVARLNARAQWETSTDRIKLHAQASASSDPYKIRGYDYTPRGRSEVGAGLSYIGEHLSVELHAQGHYNKLDNQRFRMEGSRVGLALGNWSVSLSTQDRWWGPGWDGSLILSNNARPIPSVVVDRIFTDAFDSKWLSWIGPWDFTFMMGQMESDRFVPDPLFFGMRVAFRPISSLEIGISRTAQWCGDGRPCDIDTFVKLLTGKDNRGGGGITASNEPGNQLAGFDGRYSSRVFGQMFAIYGQFIGEDEAGGFPSRYIAQSGLEWTGRMKTGHSVRVFAEYARTDCDVFGESDFFGEPCFNYVYNNLVYRTGYRYRGRVVGHAIDNDAKVATLGGVVVDANDNQWQFNLRAGRLNRGDVPDPRNSLSETQKDLLSIQVSHSRALSLGTIEVGLGYESLDGTTDIDSDEDFSLFLQWRSDF